MDTKNTITQGNVSKALLSFTLPLILSGFLQQLYNIADAVILGNFVGDVALATVASTGPVINLSIFLVFGIMSGFTILLSHLYGAQEFEKIQRLTTTAITILTLSACVIVLPIFFLKDIIFSMLNTPAQLIAGATQYLIIMFIGLPFLMLYNIYSSMLRAVGNSKISMVAIAISSVINIGLDLLFVGPFGWGVAGAAVATVIAQAISALFLMVYTHYKYPILRLKLKKETYDFGLFGQCINLGIPKVIQSMAASFGSVLIQRVTNGFGIDVMTAITTAYKIDSLTLMPLMNISTAISIFVGQNIGSGNLQRAKEGLKKGIRIAVLLSVCVTTMFVLGGGFLMSLFGVSIEVQRIGWQFLRTCAIFYPIMAIFNSYLGYFQGMKMVKFVAMCNIAALAVRIGLLYVLKGVVGVSIVALAECASWTFGCLLCIYWYHKSKRTNRSL